MRPHVLFVLLSCSLPGLAGAQQPAPAEPRLPANPQSPTDFQSTVNAPGMPQPGGAPAVTPAPPSGALGPGGEGGAEGGYSGSDMIVDEGSPALYGGGGGQARKVPQYHQVMTGDTLWDICDHYYADPWAWPQVWAYNKQITNPHWIYPGDRVRLLGAPSVATRAAERPEMMRVTGGRGQGIPQPMVQLRQNGFADPEELGRAGSIVGSPSERLLMSTLDEVYIEGTDKMQPQRGQYYSIYRVRQDLKSSDGKKRGSLVEILGTAQVRSVNEKKVATAVITESLNPIERGHKVGPLRRRFVRVPVRPAGQTVDAEVIATMRDGKYVSSDELVFVDSGHKQGVQAGNRFLVVRRGDGYKRLLQEKDDVNSKFPQETVAEITVLDARDDTSVGLVTRSVKEIKVGDKLKMRRGY